MNKTMLAYVSKHGHYNKFVALVVLWHQAYPYIDMHILSDGMAHRFNEFLSGQPQTLYLRGNEELCAMFIIVEHVRIYAGLGMARVSAY